MLFASYISNIRYQPPSCKIDACYVYVRQIEIFYHIGLNYVEEERSFQAHHLLICFIIITNVFCALFIVFESLFSTNTCMAKMCIGKEKFCAFTTNVWILKI